MTLNSNLEQKDFHKHELILRDRPCLTAYYDAIMNNKRLFENKIVLDVGSGTGILSMFAAKAGAKLVYAVDSCSGICHLAEQFIRCNRLQDRIRIINKRIEDIDKFDDNIDIIISNWMGFYLFHESMLESVIYARDHFLNLPSKNDDITPDLTESISIFPSHAYLYCAPFVDQNIRIELHTMWKDYFDFDLTPFLCHIENSNLNHCIRQTIEPSQLVGDAQLIQSIDLRTVRFDDIEAMRSICEYQFENTCIISGFCFWFDCYFSSNNNSLILRSTRLTTSPHSSKTHWKQTLVFLTDDIYPLKGEILSIHIKLKQSIDNRRQYHLTLSRKKLKENLVNSTGIDDDDVNIRKRQRRRSSTISSDKRLINETKSIDLFNESSTSNSDDDIQSTEHTIPCSCERDRCRLIKTIIEKHNQDNIVQ